MRVPRIIIQINARQYRTETTAAPFCLLIRLAKSFVSNERFHVNTLNLLKLLQWLGIAAQSLCSVSNLFNFWPFVFAAGWGLL